MKDFDLDGGMKVVEEDEIALIIQQIDILFDTQPKEVFGEPMFGADFRGFLHDMTVSASEIEAYTSNLIRSNVELFGYNVVVKADILTGSLSDIILVTIKISDNYNEYKKTYKVE